jgi:hypothetical protein
MIEIDGKDSDEIFNEIVKKKKGQMGYLFVINDHHSFVPKREIMV